MNETSQHSSSEEEWSNESSEESYYSDSDSSVPEWESSVHDITGELLFIDCHPFVTQNNVENNKKEPLQPFSKDQLRRSTRGKFLRLIRRRDSQRHSNRRQFKVQDVESSTTKVKFQDSQEGEEKEVILKISKEFQRYQSLSESLLGISVGTLSDGNRVMIAGFLSDSEAKNEKNIKIGDWLKSVNNIPVTNQNLNSVLERFIDKNEVLLKLQRVAGVEVTKDPPINELNSQSKFVREFVHLAQDEQLLDKLCQFPLGVVYLNTEKLGENNPEYDDIIYSYPHPFQKSVLCQARGIFITLNHLINEVTKTSPQSSSLLFKEQLCHLTYTVCNNNLLLFLFPDCFLTLNESRLVTKELVKMLQFLYDTVDKSFTIESYKLQLDHFFARFFTQVLNGCKWTTTDVIVNKPVELTKCLNKFEEALPAGICLKLSNEAFMQVDDALTELEASDYRDWNEEPLDCQRLFTILGSALYHSGYLLASHLMHEDLVDVHIYCKQQGLFYLSKTEPVKTLVLWKEVFPLSCRSGRKEVKVPLGKRYLLVVGSRKNLLAAIMEAGGCTEPAEENMGPDAFYVEEAQATLAHIQELGIPDLADRWLGSNPGNQVTIPDPNSKRKSDFLDTLNVTKREQRKPEVTSILKRRNSDQALFNSNFFLSEDHCEVLSEDSGSHSEVSDDTRRGEESDGDGSQSNSSFDISELRQTILAETEELQQLTAGKENVLFHFVHFDATEGVLICPPESRLQSETLGAVLDCFRAACHKIHLLFENTMRFKNMPAQDMAKSVMNKSLIAIKEHGVLFECPFLDEADSKRNRIRYWVVGRLFYMPHPREVYVCYQDTIPQNIIELAFKIDLSTMN